MLDMLALAAARRGDDSALEQLIRKYTPYVTTVIRGVGNGNIAEEDVEEIASDVFFALWQNAGKPNPLKLKAYLGQIARNKVKNRLRSLKEELPLENDWLADEGETLIDGLTREDEQNAVKRAVLSLNEPDREIFLRHYYQLQTVAKIAGEMQIGESAIKHRLERGRLKLKAILIKGGNSDEQENL
ncbi:MAG: sigma-70 family RNA polymerase sigma factor [Oscillospiraceae bacterium]|jgi:RNA polymerase sigma-70 factor (ECF subfamily)|nr:sigma-70 family RNA polymerase sigma factor [Oscillospiraceae bacterium]